MTTKAEISSFVCGTCFDFREAHYEPCACFRCHAVFEGQRAAPIALVRLLVPVDGDVARGAEQRVDFLGRWSFDARSLAMLRIAVGHEDDDTALDAVDGG